MTSIARLARRRATVISLAIVAFMSGLALYQINQESKDRTAAVQAALDNTCEEVAEFKQRFIDFAAIETKPSVYPDDITPSQRESIDNANKRRAELQDSVEHTFAPEACADGEAPPPNVTSTSTSPPPGTTIPELGRQYIMATTNPVSTPEQGKLEFKVRAIRTLKQVAGAFVAVSAPLALSELTTGEKTITYVEGKGIVIAGATAAAVFIIAAVQNYFRPVQTNP